MKSGLQESPPRQPAADDAASLAEDGGLQQLPIPSDMPEDVPWNIALQLNPSGYRTAVSCLPGFGSARECLDTYLGPTFVRTPLSNPGSPGSLCARGFGLYPGFRQTHESPGQARKAHKENTIRLQGSMLVRSKEAKHQAPYKGKYSYTITSPHNGNGCNNSDAPWDGK